MTDRLKIAFDAEDADGYCWGSRPVLCVETDTGALTIYDQA